MFSHKSDLDESTLFACLNQDSTKAQFKGYVEQLYGEFLKQICDRLTTLENPAQDKEKALQDLREELERLLELSRVHVDTTARSRKKMTEELQKLLQDIENHQKTCNEGIEHRSKDLDAQEKALAERIKLLTDRENTLADQEKQAAAGFHERRDQILEDLKKLQEDFTILNQNLREQEASCKTCITELTEERSKYYTDLSTRILEEGSQRLKDLETKIDQIRDARLTEIDSEIQQKILQANNQLKAAKRQESENELVRQELEAKAKALGQEIENRVKAQVHGLQTENAELKKQVEQKIPDLVRELNQERHKLDQLIGDIVLKEGQELSPAEVAMQYSSMKTELAKAQERLCAMPSVGEIEALRQIRREYTNLQQQVEKDSARVLGMAGKEQALQLAQVDITTLRDEVEKLKDSNADINASYQRLKETLKRYQEDDNARKQNRELCLQRLENPHDFPVTRAETRNEEDEIAWLDNICENIQKSGFIFPKRILYAFHTALKTNEMSPLTVLAGVSGTGKSELPRLYAEFGGLNYYMVPVQPNWDSQESLLGYYNSLDNRFESQPLLHFLIENKLDPEQGGINDQMSIVLLDEMNLAHVELYFAEFLSKLEQRRGMEEGNFPELAISISADQQYRIPMSDNVLWVGTMNQDETTKALSDKVIDRSTSIFFPRPGKLVARKRFGHGEPAGKRLSRESWNNWIIDIGHLYKPFEKELNAYQNEVIEPINEALGMVGRGIGHRVWQSILYYMANYPTVALYLEMYHSQQLDKNAKDAEARQGKALQELDHAFQDQLVQKIMPKLRGIECRGTGKKCLDTIAGIIEKKAGALHNDFHKAMEFGQGQFLWLSADYLNQPGTN